MDTDKLVYGLKTLPDDIGLYPAAVRGAGEHDYEERDAYKNGWNACVMDYGARIDHIVSEAETPWTKPERIFATAGEYVFMLSDGGWCVFLNDTWYYATSDAEPIPKEAEQVVANWFCEYGRAGVYYWVYQQRQELPQIPDTRKMVELVMALEKK